MGLEVEDFFVAVDVSFDVFNLFGCDFVFDTTFDFTECFEFTAEFTGVSVLTMPAIVVSCFVVELCKTSWYHTAFYR